MAVEAIMKHEGLLEKFCNPSQLEIDTVNITSKVDDESGETNRVVELGMIFYGTTECNGNNDTQVQCEVVIGEDLSIKSADCVHVNEVSQNEGKKNKIYLSH